MNSQRLRSKFIQFFTSSPRKHQQIPPSSLVPKEDPTTLFTGSGMQQLVPYLKGEPHPMGKRLVDSQPCFRAEDIEEVGDNRHTTFFEMLGNWSLGDYFKKEQLPWFFEFLTEVVGLDPQKLYVTVFEGDKNHKVFLNGKYQPLGPDVESISIWRELFKTGPAKLGNDGFDPNVKIYTYEAEKNWWSRAGSPEKMPVGEIGGPDSEVFYDFGPDHKLHEKSPFKNRKCHLNCECGRFLEIGNSVFMQYEKVAEGLLKPLPNKNVDFGGGLERIAAALEDDPDIFTTDFFKLVIKEIEVASGKKYTGQFQAPMRVMADHLKAATFMAQEGLKPGNKKQGYAMRRLIRRSVVKMMQLGIVPLKAIPKICQEIIGIYNHLYFDEKSSYTIHPIIGTEINDFLKTIHKGTKLLQTQPVSGELLFNLYQSYGFPLEIVQELLSQWGKTIGRKEREEFDEAYRKHQELSRKTSAGMFKGGLANHSEKITKLHTATHLLHAALRKVLGSHVQQVGSNITAERLRFDFTHPDKLTDEQIKKVEDLVNEQIKKNLPVRWEIMNLKKAKKQGALAFFGQKYPEKVKVYRIKDPSAASTKGGQAGQDFSLEVCGGPHVDFTDRLGNFKIKKEEAVGAGKRRIYAVLRLPK